MLKICYISNNPRRIINYRRILEEMEPESVLYRNAELFRTENAEYRFINCGNQERCVGIYADQVIIDYREPMIHLAEMITARSCVPDRYRIIDDRSIGTSNFQTKW